MRKAVVSITSNIAEGFSRRSYKEKTQFYYTALGSLTEVKSQLLIAKDVEYIKKIAFEKLENQIIDVHKLLNRFISKTKVYVS